MIILDFSSLVLMEREKDTNFLVKELGSYKVGDGAKYVTKFYYDGEKVKMYFDTGRDVLEWEYSAVYDLFNLDAFAQNGYDIEEVDDEFNPTWLIKFDYIEEFSEMEEKVAGACALIEDEIEGVLQSIEGKEEEYK